MANQGIAPAPAQQGNKQVTSPTAAPTLPEAFKPQPDPGPAPELDAFAEIEQLDEKNPADYSRPPRRKPETEKPAEKVPEKPAAAKPEAKPAEKAPEKGQKQAHDKPKEGETAKEPAEDKEPATDDKGLPGDDPSKRFQLASELRRDYRRIHAELERVNAELKQAKAGKVEPAEETKVLHSKLETLEKRNKELEEEISYRDYTKSTDFQEKFRKPFENKLARVYRQIADLYVQNEDGTQRPATQEDFDKVLEAPQSTARGIAKQIFGDEDFREVLQYRRELNELQQNADEELKNWRDKAKERDDQRKEGEKKMREQAEVTFRKAIDTYTQKYPEWFGEAEGEGAEELNKALQQGFAATDRSMDPRVPLEERLDLLAAERLKAGSFGRNIIMIKRLKARVAELEESLKAYEKSEPGEGQGQRASVAANGSGDDVPNVGDEIDRIERGNPVSR